VLARLGRFGLLRKVLLSECSFELPPVLCGEAETRKEAGLEAPQWMVRREQIVFELRPIDDRAFGMRQPHDGILASGYRLAEYA
jgi:hypothetical protein